jgi:AraC family transcriptional regulator, transcriptional activator of pobA
VTLAVAVPAQRQGDGIVVLPTQIAHLRPELPADARATLVYIARGSGWYRQGTRSTQVGPGSLSLVVPGQACDVRGLGPTLGWIVRFRPDAAGVRLASATPVLRRPTWTLPLPSAALTVPVAARPRWEGRLRELAHELDARATGYGPAAQAHLTLLLVDLARLGLPPLDGPGQRREPVLAAVFGVLDTRFAEPLTLADVAQAVALSPRHLTRLVRRLTGATVMDWLLERRMAEARRRLLETDTPVELIAAQVGYRHPGHFRQQFRRLHGRTPSAWRAQARTGAA